MRTVNVVVVVIKENNKIIATQTWLGVTIRKQVSLNQFYRNIINKK